SFGWPLTHMTRENRGGGLVVRDVENPFNRVHLHRLEPAGQPDIAQGLSHRALAQGERERHFQSLESRERRRSVSILNRTRQSRWRQVPQRQSQPVITPARAAGR